MRIPRCSILLIAAACVTALAACSTAPAAAGPAIPSDWPTSMLAGVNAVRATAGIAPLRECPSLDRSAQKQSGDQAATRTLSHIGADHSTIVQRANRAGYVGWTSLAENVASGQGSVSAVITAWMSDAAHRTNLFSPTSTDIGFGVGIDSAGVPYWTQDFGSGGAC